DFTGSAPGAGPALPRPVRRRPGPSGSLADAGPAPPATLRPNRPPQAQATEAGSGPTRPAPAPAGPRRRLSTLEASVTCDDPRGRRRSLFYHPVTDRAKRRE